MPANNNKPKTLFEQAMEDAKNGKGNAVIEQLLEEAKKKRPPVENQITEKNIEQVEKETIEIASRAIYVLEDALSKWEGFGDKPEEIKVEFDKFKSFHSALVEWEQKILKSKASDEQLDFYARVDRLKEYARICFAHR